MVGSEDGASWQDETAIEHHRRVKQDERDTAGNQQFPSKKESLPRTRSAAVCLKRRQDTHCSDFRQLFVNTSNGCENRSVCMER